MKEILKPHLNGEIKIRQEKNSSTGYYYYDLISLTDSYFAILDDGNTDCEAEKRYIPYTSISQIIDDGREITIELNSTENILERLDEINEELLRLKGCIIGNSVPLGEIMRKTTEIDEKLKSVKDEMDTIERQISNLETSIKFI